MDAAGVFRNLVSRGDLIVAPGVYDALSAEVAQYCKFQAIYMTGFGTPATRIFFLWRALLKGGDPGSSADSFKSPSDQYGVSVEGDGTRRIKRDGLLFLET